MLLLLQQINMAPPLEIKPDYNPYIRDGEPVSFLILRNCYSSHSPPLAMQAGGGGDQQHLEDHSSVLHNL